MVKWYPPWVIWLMSFARHFTNINKLGCLFGPSLNVQPWVDIKTLSWWWGDEPLLLKAVPPIAFHHGWFQCFFSWCCSPTEFIHVAILCYSCGYLSPPGGLESLTYYWMNKQRPPMNHATIRPPALPQLESELKELQDQTWHLRYNTKKGKDWRCSSCLAVVFCFCFHGHSFFVVGNVVVDVVDGVATVFCTWCCCLVGFFPWVWTINY